MALSKPLHAGGRRKYRKTAKTAKTAKKAGKRCTRKSYGTRRRRFGFF